MRLSLKISDLPSLAMELYMELYIDEAKLRGIGKQGNREVAQNIMPDSGKKNGLFWCGCCAFSWHKNFCY
jgi:hypothetical protein